MAQHPRPRPSIKVRIRGDHRDGLEVVLKVIGMTPGRVQSFTYETPHLLALMVSCLHRPLLASRLEGGPKAYSMTLSGLTMRPLSSDEGL